MGDVKGVVSGRCRKGIIGVLLVLVPLCAGCELTYLFHVAAGQFRLVSGSIPLETALEGNSLAPPQKEHLLLVPLIKDFGEKELGLRKTQNYQTVYLKSSQRPIYTVSASPKDRLTRKTWWFPVVGDMPYLGFFDRENAKAEKEELLKRGLDVTVGMADAYSTLGWFQDPVTLNLIDGSTVNLVETILHEMTHTTLYVKGQGEFNEGLAVLVGKVGAVRFLEKNYGFSNHLTIEAKKALEDEAVFSGFLATLFERLELLYNSPIGYQEKLIEREKIFSEALVAFGRVAQTLKTRRFIHFGRGGLNNAYLMSVGLYHRHFHLFETVLQKQGGSVKGMLAFFQGLSKQEGDILERAEKEIFKKGNG